MLQRYIASILNQTQILGGNHNMTGKPTINTQVIPRHLLSQATITSAGGANRAVIAWHYCRYNYLFTHPPSIASHYSATNFMT
jgi:hypothetical protein